MIDKTDMDKKIIGTIFRTKSIVSYLFATRPGQSIIQGELVEVDYNEQNTRSPEKYLARITHITHQNFIIDEMGSVQLSSLYEKKPDLTLDELNLGGAIQDYTIGDIEIIGRRERNIFVRPNKLLRIGSKVRKASKRFLEEQIKSSEEDILNIGKFRFNEDISIDFNLDKLITLHFCILAMTGGGKSWTLSVIVEEIAKNYELPIIIFDPHGEYSSLLIVNEKLSDENKIEQAKKITKKIEVYTAGDQFIIKRRDVLFEEKYKKKRDSVRILIDMLDLSTDQLIYIVNNLYNLSEAQARVLLETWTDIREKRRDLTDETNLDEICETIFKDYEQNNRRLNQRTQEILKTKLKLFYRDSKFIRQSLKESKISLKELIKMNKISIIDISALDQIHQQILVGTICNQLLNSRIQNAIPPVLILLEEAHRFTPGGNQPSASKKIIKRIAQEGRKFMTGLGIISQRPSRLDSDVLSQCNTQIIMRLTNPIDQSYVRQISEYVTDSDLEIIRSLSPGEGIAFGSSILFSLPIKINSERFTEHGGAIPKITEALKKWKK